MTTQTQHAGPDERSELRASLVRVTQLLKDRDTLGASLALADVEKLIDALLTDSKAGGEVFGWFMRLGTYAPVFLEQSDPPHPFTFEEAVAEGWRPLYTHTQQQAAHDDAALEALGWQRISCPVCGADGARAVPKQAAQAAVPRGWRLVPVEPTPEMIDCWGVGCSETDADLNAANLYRAMLSAAPVAAQQAERVPLTETQIFDAFKSEPLAGYAALLQQAGDIKLVDVRAAVIRIGRSIEAARGIALAPVEQKGEA